MQLLVFRIDGQRFGIPASQAREVVRAVMIEPLPGAPEIVEGVIDVRGAIVPVFDIRRRFGLRAAALDPAEHFVIAWTGARVAALRVSEVIDLETAADAAAEAADITVGLDRISGVARTADGLILIHDLARFLEAEEARHLEQAMRQNSP